MLQTVQKIYYVQNLQLQMRAVTQQLSRSPQRCHLLLKLMHCRYRQFERHPNAASAVKLGTGIVKYGENSPAQRDSRNPVNSLLHSTVSFKFCVMTFSETSVLKAVMWYCYSFCSCTVFAGNVLNGVSKKKRHCDSNNCHILISLVMF